MAHTASGMTRGDIELLALLCEELAEATQAACKVLRHGREGSWQDQTFDNTADLEVELGHVLAAVRLLDQSRVIKEPRLLDSRDAKLTTIGEFLHFQPGQSRRG